MWDVRVIERRECELEIGDFSNHVRTHPRRIRERDERMKPVAMISLTLMMTSMVTAQFPAVTVRQIQEVPLDSLLILDSLQCTVSSRWNLQASPYYHDTVSLTAVCVLHASTLDYTASGFNLLLADTGAPSPWSGILARPGTVDTVLVTQWGILNIHSGDIIRFVGWVDEFPSLHCTSVTQIVPVLTIPLEILGTAPLPAPASVQISEFYTGVYPFGLVRYSTAEQYEFQRVQLHNVEVVSQDPVDCVLGLADSLPEVLHARLPGSRLDCPPYPPGTRLTSIAGVVTTGATQQGPDTYQIFVTDTSDVNVTGVGDHEKPATRSYELACNYPNPFNPVTTIAYTIPARGRVSLKVFDILGRELRTLVDEDQQPGPHSVTFDASGISSGIYFYRLRAGSSVATQKMVLVR
jgi:hypothetical protein